MLGGVVEVDELDAVREHATEECPVVARPVGNLDPLEVRTLARHRLDLRGHHRLERPLLRLRHPCHAYRRESRSLAVMERDRGTARLPVPAATASHRRHHRVERHRHGARGVRNFQCVLAQTCLELATPRLPTRRERLRQPVQRALRRHHVAQRPQHLLGLARHQVRSQHRALACRIRRPVPLDDADRPRLLLALRCDGLRDRSRASEADPGPGAVSVARGEQGGALCVWMCLGVGALKALMEAREGSGPTSGGKQSMREVIADE